MTTPPPPGGPHPPLPPYGHGGAAVPPFRPLDALDFAWTAFRRQWVAFLGVTVLMFALAIGIELGSSLVTTGTLAGAQVDPVTGMPVGGWGAVVSDLLGSLLGLLVQFVCSAALVRGALDMVDTGCTSLAEMFTRIPWLHLVLASILVFAITLVGTLLCIIPGIIAAFLLVLTPTAVVDGAPATGAIVASFRVVKDNVVEVLLLALVFIGLGILSLCTLGIGLLVVTPMFSLALAYGWRVLQGRPVTSLAAGVV